MQLIKNSGDKFFFNVQTLCSTVSDIDELRVPNNRYTCMRAYRLVNDTNILALKYPIYMTQYSLELAQFPI